MGTDSAYYPVSRSMFRNVVAALNEALDITLFLLPLAKHFEVSTVEPRYNIKVGNHLFFYYIEVFYYNEFLLISYKCNIFDISDEFMVYTRCAISVYDLKYSD